MRVTLQRLVLVWLLTGLAGCMSFELEGDCDMTHLSHNESATVHGSLYRKPWSSWDVIKCTDGGLARVEYTTNAGFLLVSVLSLGIYVPQTVEWWCCAPEEFDDEDEPLLEAPANR